jgi:hypothetical protein
VSRRLDSRVRERRRRERAERAALRGVLRAVRRKLGYGGITSDGDVLVLPLLLVEFQHVDGAWRLWLETRVRARDRSVRLLPPPLAGWDDPASIERLVATLKYWDQ